ncbi:MAG: DUF1080 domain-containing protein [Tunicatimonas sp.]
MKNDVFLLWLSVGLITACTGNQSATVDQTTHKPVQTAEQTVSDDFVPLFNGTDLSGWQIHGTEKWYVEDGLLVCESGPDAEYGYLATEKSYKNFVLELEFKQAADGNSGVFFRSSLDGTKISGWQVEVAPPDHDTGGIYESYGRGWLEQIPEEKEGILKMGEWNQLRIEVNGDRVQTFLNGEPMVDLTDEKIGAADGVIALQIHDGGGIKVFWRDLRIKAIL